MLSTTIEADGNYAFDHKTWMYISYKSAVQLSYLVHLIKIVFGIVRYLSCFRPDYTPTCINRTYRRGDYIEQSRYPRPLLTILVTPNDFYVPLWARLVTWRTINAFIRALIFFSLLSLYSLSTIEL